MAFGSGRGFRSNPGFRANPNFRSNGGLGGGGGEPPPDGPPALLSGPTLVGQTSTSLTLTWTSDQFVQSWFDYGTTASYGSESDHETSFDYKTHIQTITGLSAGTTYHVRVHLVNQYGGNTVSNDFTFATDAAAPSASLTYGPAIYGDTLFNEYIGGPQSLQLSYRIRMQRSGVLASIRVYTIVYNAGGYSAGDGGKARVRVYADDGTSDHFPTGSALATSTTFTPGNPPSTDFPVFSFASSYNATAGEILHFVFDNPHASPGSNYMSLDQLCDMTSTPANPYQPKYPDSDLAFLVKAGAGAWHLRSPFPQFTPIYSLAFSGGTSQGMGYMETGNPSWIASIGGNDMVRERFTVSGGDKTVTALGACLSRFSGSGVLSMRLETGTGTEIETVTVPAASIAVNSASQYPRGAQTRVSANLVTPRTLTSGQTYNLRLSAASGTVYRTHSLRKGSAYGFTTSTYFADGVGQKSSNGGSSWTGVHTSGGDWTGDEDIMVTMFLA